MYQEKEKSKVFKTLKKSKKSMALLASLLLLVFATVGGTVAFLMDKTNEKVNQFTPSEITTTVVEELNGQTKSNVKIQNTGDTEAYIRAAVVVNWKNAAGNIYGKVPVAGTDYQIEFNTNSQTVPEGKWTLAKDGFYYWSNPVAAPEFDDGGNVVNASKCATGVLITSCTPKKDAPADGYYLNVEIIGSGIQSKPKHVVTTEWSSGVDEFASENSTTLVVKTN